MDRSSPETEGDGKKLSDLIGAVPSPPGLGLPADLELSATAPADGTDEDDANNLDTFGDCEVGDDWQPTVAQDFFAREHEEHRAGKSAKAADDKKDAKSMPTCPQTEPNLPPGLQGSTPASVPLGPALSALAASGDASAVQAPTPPLPSALLGLGAPGARGPASPLAGPLAMGAVAAGRPPGYLPGAELGAGLFAGPPPLSPELAAAWAAKAAAGAPPASLLQAFPPPGFLPPGMPPFAPPFMGPRGAPLPFPGSAPAASLGGHAPGRPMPPPGLAADLAVGLEAQVAGRPPGSILSSLASGFPLGSMTGPTPGAAAPLLGPPGMMHPPGLPGSNPALHPSVMAMLGMPPPQGSLRGPPIGPFSPPAPPMHSPGPSGPPKVFSVAELEKGMIQDAGKAAGAALPTPASPAAAALAAFSAAAQGSPKAAAAVAAAAAANRQNAHAQASAAGLLPPADSALAASVLSKVPPAAARAAAQALLMQPGVTMPSTPLPQVASMPRVPPPPPSTPPASTLGAGVLPGDALATPLHMSAAADAARSAEHLAQEAYDSEEEEEAAPPGRIAPFTQAHRAQLLANADSAAATGSSVEGSLRLFLRGAGPRASKLKQHAGIMSSSDKELIVRIQLSQMAAMGGAMGAPVGGEASSSRGHLMRGAQPLEEKELQPKDAPSPSHGSSQGHTPAGTLVTQLQASISESEGSSASLAASPPESADGDKVAASRAETDDVSTAADDASSAGDDALRSGLRADEKFGKSRYASVHHPRRTLAVPSREPSGDVDAPGEQAVGGAYWCTQFALEACYGTLFDIEQISCRLSDSDPSRDDGLEKLLRERGEKLDRVSQQLFDGLIINDASGESPDANSKEQATKPTPPLLDFLAYRKGRMLVHRLLVCLAADRQHIEDAAASAATAAAAAAASATSAGTDPAPTDTADAVTPAAPLATSLLWRLVLAVLSMPAVLLELAKSPSASVAKPNTGITPKDVSWRKLRWSLVRSLQSTLKSRSPALSGSGRPAVCAEALAVLLDSHVSEELAVLCMLKHGLALLRLLIDGCREVDAPSATEPPAVQSEAVTVHEMVEAVRGRLVEALCKALPALYKVATSHELPASGAEGLSLAADAELLSQEELWALLIALTEQANASQKRRVRDLIGKFVSEVDTRTGRDSTQDSSSQPSLSRIPEG